MNPRFSVVVPTRERAETLRSCLRTVLAQSFDDYEVIVCDNASSPATRQTVAEFRSPRVRYVRSDAPLAMSDNWELAVSHARGDYLTVLGDDDGLMPSALADLYRLIDQYDRPGAVQWFAGLYTWPTIAVPEEANFLRLPLDSATTLVSGRDQLIRASRYEIGTDSLPMIYRSVIRADLVARHKEIVGRVFPTLYPDVYSGYAFAYLAGRYVTTSVPLSIAGLSGKSNGVATLMRTDANPIAEEFERLHKQSGYVRHPTVPNVELLPVNADDSFQYARDFFFARDPFLELDRKKAAERYLAAIPDHDPEARARVKAKVRLALADRPDLLPWFDAMPDLPPCAPFRCRPAKFGYDGWGLTLDATKFGVTDVESAVNLAADVLGARGGARFDVPSRQQANEAWQAAVTGREEDARRAEAGRAEAEARFAQAQQERDAYRLRWSSADDECDALRQRVARLEAEAAALAAAVPPTADRSLIGMAKRVARKLVG